MVTITTVLGVVTGAAVGPTMVEITVRGEAAETTTAMIEAVTGKGVAAVTTESCMQSLEARCHYLQFCGLEWTRTGSSECARVKGGKVECVVCFVTSDTAL